MEEAAVIILLVEQYRNSIDELYIRYCTEMFSVWDTPPPYSVGLFFSSALVVSVLLTRLMPTSCSVNCQ